MAAIEPAGRGRRRRWLGAAPVGWHAARRGLGLGLLLLSLLPGLATAAPGECGAPGTTPVHALAGQGAERLAPEGPVTVEAVVTAAFLGDAGLDGFFVQGAAPAPDGAPSGLFVYAPEPEPGWAEAIEPGRRLRLTGYAGAYRGRPQLEGLEALADCGRGEIDSRAVAWPLPEAKRARLEGVRVRIETPMAMTANGELARYGSLMLTPRRRAFRATNFRAGEGPADPALRGQRLILDDGAYRRSPRPIPHLGDGGTRRVGSRAAGLEGVLTHAFGRWRLHPVRPPRWQAANPRPEALPPPGPGTVRVAAFNLQNYFLTLGERGAATPAELACQRRKLLAALQALRADVLALTELERRRAAAADLVERLRRASGAPWRLVRAPARGDAVTRVALAYRADRVAPGEAPARRDRRPVHHRPPLAAAFEPAGGGAPFAVAVAHLKSKGGCPERGDVDRGEGCWSERRVEQAEALDGFLAAWRARHGAPPALITGDLNAYGAEEPIRTLTGAGRADLLAERLPWRARYTYVFRGEAGYLHHLLAPPRLAGRAAAVRTLAINADEPRFLRYDAAGDGSRRCRGPYRSSDHDPVAVDLRIAAPGHEP